MALDGDRGAVARSQDSAHGNNYDYTKGSPHLRHVTLRKRADEAITAAVVGTLERQDQCTVLEIGAGHGFFTDTVIDAGGTVTVTEMSKASFDHLTSRFGHVANVRILYDADGTTPFAENNQYDVILMISVIHHIPDYIDVINRLCDSVLRSGGTIVTFQDPLWYPRQAWWKRAVTWGSYFAWRITQGELRRGLATRWRRLRGLYSESNPSDLVEYHVVRSGVDEVAIHDLLSPRFEDVVVDKYFSTQSPHLQKLGEKYLPPNTFGIVARNFDGK